MTDSLISDPFVELILLLIVISIFINIFFPDRFFEQYSKVTEKKPSVTVLDEQINISDSIKEPKYEYTIQLSGSVKSSNANSYLDIIPLVSFKDMDKKAKADGEDSFILPATQPKETTLSASILSIVPPIKRLDAISYSGIMKKYDSYVLNEGEKDLLMLTLLDVKKGIIPIVSKCHAYFKLECKDTAQIINLRSGCEDDEMLDCSRDMKICGGDFHISATNVDCGNNEVTITAEFSGKGTDTFKAAETLDVSFWQNSECTQENHDYKSLIASCQKDFLGLQSFSYANPIATA